MARRRSKKPASPVCRSLRVGTVLGLGEMRALGLRTGFGPIPSGLGRPVPRTCPAETRITVPAHTRCPPPKRGGRKRPEPKTGRRRKAPAEPEPERAPLKRAYEPHELPRFHAAEARMTKVAAEGRRREQAGKPLTKAHEELAYGRAAALERAEEEVASWVDFFGKKKPDFSTFEGYASRKGGYEKTGSAVKAVLSADPCLGITFAEFNGGQKAGLDKRHWWNEQTFGCVLTRWCAKNPDRCYDEFGSDAATMALGDEIEAENWSELPSSSEPFTLFGLRGKKRKRSRARGIGGADTSYRGGHTAPDRRRGSPLFDLTKSGTYPKDVYTHPRYYTDGSAGEEATMRLVRGAHGKPALKVTVYRAVPKTVEGSPIHAGDWVTPSRAYAAQHAQMMKSRGEPAKIVSRRVRADELYTDGNSIHEWGYDPGTE